MAVLSYPNQFCHHQRLHKVSPVIFFFFLLEGTIVINLQPFREQPKYVNHPICIYTSVNKHIKWCRQTSHTKSLVIQHWRQQTWSSLKMISSYINICSIHLHVFIIIAIFIQDRIIWGTDCFLLLFVLNISVGFPNVLMSCV